MNSRSLNSSLMASAQEYRQVDDILLVKATRYKCSFRWYKLEEHVLINMYRLGVAKHKTKGGTIPIEEPCVLFCGKDGKPGKSQKHLSQKVARRSQFAVIREKA
ncbi:hypothetical protein L1987_68940 [Smallanthus sonchifolius]|uniref:Uncharacterized protein n=1 Tax=Smallanthus sonchifolius TaxID=185202 RepID=A0ACB9B586_9ASTR|nr:hypothetical protein L1987_68940 [Smallanthus sonchifolius]